jgi:DNA end-binding protein Ku
MLRPSGQGLVMQQLLYADEVRPFSEIGLSREPVKEAEMKLATMLVEQSASDEFRPDEYEDEVRKRVHDQIQKKVQTGQEISSAPKPKSGDVIDLMEALRRSLSESEARPRRPARRANRSVEKKAASKR